MKSTDTSPHGDSHTVTEVTEADRPSAKALRRADNTDLTDPILGKTIDGRYRVLELAACGGMGKIYRAEQLPLGRSVAFKVLRPDCPPRKLAEFQSRFLLEAATCARLKHPNTVTVFDYGPLNLQGLPGYYMALEWVDGRTLKQVIADERNLSPSRVLTIARQIGRSLREAHAEGVVHRDLKPSNVMLVQTDEGESVKVLDFGIAKIHADAGAIKSLELTGDRVIGSPPYMSPEQVRQQPIDSRSDIYSLGVMLFEMLTGRLPFESTSMVEVLTWHTQGTTPTFAEMGFSEVPEALEEIVRNCLQKNPDNRFPSIETFMEAISGAVTTMSDGKPSGLITHSDFSQKTISTDAVARREPDQATPARIWLGRLAAACIVAVIAVVGGTMLSSNAGSSDSSRDANTNVDIGAPSTIESTHAPLPKQSAVLEITLKTKPTGALVREDNVVIGKTPLRVRLGTTRVFTFSRPGYRPVTRTYDVTSEDTAVVRLSRATRPKKRRAPELDIIPIR